MSDWTPLRWMSGPLDSARREKAGDLTSQAKEALQRWHEPSALAFLNGGPVTCLVVSWAAGLPQDAEQQRTLKPLIDQGRKAGLEFVGMVEDPADKQSAVASARDAGLAAIAAGTFVPGGFPTILWAERARIDRKAPLVAVSDGVWPGVQQRPRSEAGPTGAPWLDSNGWAAQLVRTLNPGKPVWFAFDPPAKASPRASAYVTAVADVECRGCRWPISLDDSLRAGLAAGNERALTTWKAIADTLRFFRAHKQWATLAPVAVLGVISDFAGPNEFLSTEILNLSARRLLPFRVIDKAAAQQAPLTGLRAVVYPDEQPPAEPLRKKLLAFVNDGGVLLTGPSWKFPEGAPAAPDPYKRYNIRRLGKGRIAIPREENQDPYLVAADVQLLMSHRYDLMRFFNAGLLGPYLTSTPDGTKAVLHIVNYSGGFGAREVSATLRDKFASAALWRPEKPDAAAPLKVLPCETGGIEVQLPELGTYSAIELEK